MRTILAVTIALLISLMFTPHSGRGLLRFMGYAHGPFFIQPSYVDWKQLVLQTIIIAIAAAVIVNLLPRKKLVRPNTFTKSDRAKTNAASI